MKRLALIVVGVCLYPAYMNADAATNTTGFVYHESFLEHDTGPVHPEAPARLTAIVKRLADAGLRSKLSDIESSPAPLEWITTVHTAEYVARVRDVCAGGVPFLDSMDTPVSENSYEVALLASGGVLNAVDAVMAGRVKNAFCAVRPPGHHALKEAAMGFCLFNNVAVGTRYIQKKYGLPKVLIVDWDVHHGNGTQDVFYDDSTVLFFSVHQYPFYPGSGAGVERGAGKGSGFTINIPLARGSGDKAYRDLFEKELRPAALKFKPDFILISAGFDAHEDDPLGEMGVTAKGFADMTKVVKAIAESCCDGRLVSVLEGGYDLKGLADSVLAHVSVLAD